MFLTPSRFCDHTGQICVAYQDIESQEQYECRILDIPNWGFSYALALFNLDGDETEEKTNDAIKTAICRFPFIVSALLKQNEIDASSRSFRTDWPSALKFLDELDIEFQKRIAETYKSDPFTKSRISQTYGTIAQIFVQQNFKFWSSSKVLTWVYENVMVLREERKNTGWKEPLPLSPAIIRYMNADRTDYEDKFQTMPADANPFDPNIIQLALNVDPNRRRLVQRNPRHGGAHFMDENGNDFA